VSRISLPSVLGRWTSIIWTATIFSSALVDFAGDTLPGFDGLTGEVRAAKIFVAVLGASNYTFAQARNRRNSHRRIEPEPELLLRVVVEPAGFEVGTSGLAGIGGRSVFSAVFTSPTNTATRTAW
jgi:hypothetical protein